MPYMNRSNVCQTSGGEIEHHAQGLDEGALGIGINAGYAPGNGQKEYFALAELAAERDVATFTHVRYASNMEPNSSFQAIQDGINSQ